MHCRPKRPRCSTKRTNQKTAQQIMPPNQRQLFQSQMQFEQVQVRLPTIQEGQTYSEEAYFCKKDNIIFAIPTQPQARIFPG